MSEEKRRNNKRFNLGLIISFVLLSLTLAGLVWKSALTSSMAQEAYKFTSENATLPYRVTAIEEQTRKLNLSAEKLIEVGTIQKMIREDQKIMKDDIGKILDAVNKIRTEK